MRLALLCLVGLAVPMLAGCTGPRSSALPPVFSIDAIRYWWEGQSFIVNVTFTNHANHTLGVGENDPEIDIGVGGVRGVHYGDPNNHDVPDNNYRVRFSTWIQGNWSPRFNHGAIVGPMFIQPNQTLSAEFEFLDFNNFSGDQGFYGIRVTMHASGANRLQAEYTTGCFNHNTTEFYGVHPSGKRCDTWDCTGESTEVRYRPYVNNGRQKSPYAAVCNLTNSVGPYYE